MRFVSCLVVFLVSAALMAVTAQTSPTEEKGVVRVDTELVDVPLTVTDKTGKPILSLKKSNFLVFEDGKPQQIAEFSAVSAPFEVALLLDTSGSTRSELLLIRRAAQEFIASLRPGDRVSIVAFRSVARGDRSIAETEVVGSLTSDRTALRSALDQVGMSNGTPYYDGLVDVAEKVFGREPAEQYRGRRALVALTDGVDSSSIQDFEEARIKLTEKGISNYFINVDTRPFFEANLLGDCHSAIRFSQAQIKRYYASFSRNSKIERTSDFCQIGDFERLAISKKLYELAEAEMKELARLSGGRVFPVGDLNEARGAFKQVADDIGTRYRIGYYPTNEKRDSKFRAIRVELKGLPAGVTVRAREGYTAPAN